MIHVPDEFQDRDVEIIILPLNQNGKNGENIERDAMGYPVGFFERTAGSLADDPIERAPQGDFDLREEMN